MLFTSRILVAIDASPEANAALLWASRLGVAFAGVDVMNVWQSSTNASPAQVRTEATEWLKKTVAAVKFRGTSTVGRRLESGDPSMVLLQCALRQSGNLVIVGTRGEGEANSSLGTVAVNLLKSAPCPVLFVSKPPQVAEGPLSILVPTDFSMASTGALKFAGALAEEAGGIVDTMHVITSEELVDGLIEKRTVQLSEYVREGGLPASVLGRERVLVGDPATVIAESAAPARTYAPRSPRRSDSYDLIVINAHGRTGPKGGAVGNVAERVAYAHPCATLVARDHFTLTP